MKIKPLNQLEIQKQFSNLKAGWRINNQGHLYKEYKFKDFTTPMEFANKIAQLAEKEGHHPDLKISWGLCSVEIWTHAINGISKNDFALASKIEALLFPLEEAK